MLLTGGVDSAVVLAITDVDCRPTGVPGNAVNDARLIRDIGWLHDYVTISGY